MRRSAVENADSRRSLTGLRQAFLALALAAAGPNVLESVAPPSSRELCGTWMLVDRVDRTPDGRVVPERGLGPDPLGILIYDAAGNMSVQIMKRAPPSLPGLRKRSTCSWRSV